MTVPESQVASVEAAASFVVTDSLADELLNKFATELRPLADSITDDEGPGTVLNRVLSTVVLKPWVPVASPMLPGPVVLLPSLYGAASVADADAPPFESPLPVGNWRPEAR